MKTVIKILSLMLIVSLTLFAVSAGAEVNPDTSEPEAMPDDVVDMTDNEAEYDSYPEEMQPGQEEMMPGQEVIIPPELRPAFFPEEYFFVDSYPEEMQPGQEVWIPPELRPSLYPYLYSHGSSSYSTSSQILNHPVTAPNGQWCIVRYKEDVVYTPNNKAVPARYYLDNMTAEMVENHNTYIGGIFILATRISDANSKYNCHSYAWHSQSTANSYWIGDPSEFCKDRYYQEVSNPQPGDIVCYFNNVGENLHSGIIRTVLNNSSPRLAGNLTVISKWGAAGVYLHNGYECPYTAYSGGDATSVKYYRHIHSYTYINLGVSAGHRCTCDFCGESTTEAHSWLAISNGYRCGKCNAFTTYLPGIITSIPEDILEKMKEYEGLSEYAFAVDDNMIFCYVDGTCYFVEGNDEAAALAQVKNPAAELQGEEDLTS